MSFKTPILFIVFNRPHTTQRVFDEIRNVQPVALFIAADGPREGNFEDINKCRSVREVASQIDWPCKVTTLYRDANLGCKVAVSGAIDWFFEQVEEGIILEDDVLPNRSFFHFCETMLDRYRHDAGVMHIGGFNILGKWKAARQSYHFNYFGTIWGWATWRRCWSFYDVDIKQWADPEIQNMVLMKYFPISVRKERKDLYDSLLAGKIDTWDYQWALTRYINGGLSIIPSVNLVVNIGFDRDATHTSLTPTWNVSQAYPLLSFDKQPRLAKADLLYDEKHLLLTSILPRDTIFRLFIPRIRKMLSRMFHRIKRYYISIV